MEQDNTDTNASSRIVSTCLDDESDYMDDQIRRIFVIGRKFTLEDKIFHENISVRLPDNDVDIEIKNCHFTNGLSVLWSGAKDYDYSVFIFKTRIEGHLNLAVGDGEKNISLDSCHLTELLVSGKCKKIDLFKTTIGLFTAEYCKCQQFEVSDSKIDQYALFKFEAYEVNFDNDKLAITDMTRFKARSKQTTKEVSESYWRIRTR